MTLKTVLYDSVDGKIIMFQDYGPFEVDGIRYRGPSFDDDFNYSTTPNKMFELKKDRNCTDEEYCDCNPKDYVPEKIEKGEICDPCWLQYGDVNGIESHTCPH